MKKKILITLLLSVMPLCFGHSAEVSPSSGDTGFLKTEWLEKIYQANRVFETAEVWYNVFDEEGIFRNRQYIALDLPNKRMLMAGISPTKNPLVQGISSLFVNNGQRINVHYEERKTANLNPSFQDVKDGSASIENGVHDAIFTLEKFFIFDEVGGQQYCVMLKSLPPNELWKKAKEIEFKGRKCLEFSDSLFGKIIFEKERGIVLSKTFYVLNDNDRRVPYKKVEYSDHQVIDGVWFPMSVHRTSYSEEGEEISGKPLYRIKPEDVKFNHKIPEDKFVPKIPKGFGVQDHTNGFHYISTGFTRERENAIKKQLDEIFEGSEK